jgi:hypothetical protein
MEVYSMKKAEGTHTMTDPRLLNLLIQIERRMHRQTDALHLLTQSVRDATSAINSHREFFEALAEDEKSRAEGDLDPAGD